MEKVIESNLLIGRMLSSLGELPAAPGILTAVIDLTTDVNADIVKLDKLLSADQSLAAKLLKIANSSFYGLSKSVRSIRQAIMIIGFDTLRSIVIAASTHSLYSGLGKNPFERRLWEHSLATALASRQTARKIRHSHSEEAFVSGLLHDIGKLVLWQKMRKEYQVVLSQIEKQPRPFVEVEEELLGFSHVDVGMMLLTKWNLPREMVTAVYKHHQPELGTPEGQVPEPAELPLELLIDFGNRAAAAIGHKSGGIATVDLASAPLSSLLKFTDEELQGFTEQFGVEFESGKSNFEA